MVGAVFTNVSRRFRAPERPRDATAPASFPRFTGEAIIESVAVHDGAIEVDPFVQEQVPYTNGFLYRPLQYRLPRYPIPTLRIPLGNGARFLDVGCNWGRWAIAASYKGYRVSGIDPSPAAIVAARRVARQLTLDIDFRSGSGEIIHLRVDGEL